MYILFLYEIDAKFPDLDVQQNREEISIKPIHPPLSEKWERFIQGKINQLEGMFASYIGALGICRRD
jgi:hypothetical protein